MNGEFLTINNKVFIEFENYWNIRQLDKAFAIKHTFHISEGKYFFVDESGEITKYPTEWIIVKIGIIDQGFLILDKEVFSLDHSFKIEDQLVNKLEFFLA